MPPASMPDCCRESIPSVPSPVTVLLRVASASFTDLKPLVNIFSHSCWSLLSLSWSGNYNIVSRTFRLLYMNLCRLLHCRLQHPQLHCNLVSSNCCFEARRFGSPLAFFGSLLNIYRWIKNCFTKIIVSVSLKRNPELLTSI